MTFTLHLDTDRWRAHQATMLAEGPGLVPVVKGNGYGFGLERLAGECQRLGVDTLAVGLPGEVARVRGAFTGDVVVMTPWHPRLPADLPADPALVRTVSHLEAAQALRGTGARVVLELATSMRRHGLTGEELARAAGACEGLRVEGVALHLPMTGDGLAQARRLLAQAESCGIAHDVVWVSHLRAVQRAALAQDRPGRRVRLRSGTRLWLGDPGSFAARGRVLDVHRLAAGDAYGYRQRRARRAGWLVVVGGGTTHGVALEAPSSVQTIRSRVTVLALAGLEAAGSALSPFTIAGRRRPFAEPPHMQVSMLLLAGSATPPALGDEVDVTVRMTTVTFDAVVEAPLA